MKYNPDRYRRRSIRLQGYDYTSPNAYFVTICSYNHESLFGDVKMDKIVLNQFGRIIFEKWNQIPKYFKNTQIDQFIIMPNHLHGIVIIVTAKHSSEEFTESLNNKHKNASPSHPAGTMPDSVSSIIQNFKSVTTRKINQIRKTSSAKLWQRNYYEHIVRNEKELNQIREYIIDNPLKWEFDEDNPKKWERLCLI